MDLLPPGPSAVRTRVTRVVVVVGVFLLALTGCSDDGGDDADDPPSATLGTSPPTTTTAPTSTTTTVEDVEAEVEAAYLAAEAAFYEVGASPGSADELSETRVGPSLTLAQDFMAGLDTAGQVLEPRRRAPDPEVRSVDVADDQATLEVCDIDDSVIVTVSGEVVNDDVSSALVTAEMRFVDGRWRLYDAVEVSSWPDGVGCDRD